VPHGCTGLGQLQLAEPGSTGCSWGLQLHTALCLTSPAPDDSLQPYSNIYRPQLTPATDSQLQLL
jgi:hypothetical protein